MSRLRKASGSDNVQSIAPANDARRRDANGTEGNQMLKPFAMTEIKVKTKPLNWQQRSLWAVRAIPDPKTSVLMLKDVPEIFVSITPIG